MLSFTCDYSEGACPEILRRLGETNLEQLPGYGEDKYSESAKEKIRSVCGAPQADVFFLIGGTQTNSTIIATMLRDFEGVVAAETGHVALHEAGAVEYTGHKVLTIPGHQGKIDTDELSAFMETFFADANHEHMVFAGMVYISYPTEVAEGTSWDDWIANSLQVASDGYDEHYTIKAYPTYAKRKILVGIILHHEKCQCRADLIQSPLRKSSTWQMLEPFHLACLYVVWLCRVIDIRSLYDPDIHLAVDLRRINNIIPDFDLVAKAVQHARATCDVSFLGLRKNLSVFLLKRFPICLNQRKITDLMPSNCNQIVLQEQLIVQRVNAPYSLVIVLGLALHDAYSLLLNTGSLSMIWSIVLLSLS